MIHNRTQWYSVKVSTLKSHPVDPGSIHLHFILHLLVIYLKYPASTQMALQGRHRRDPRAQAR